jgi:ribosomal protein S18 acetylase RimI-like enzyme
MNPPMTPEPTTAWTRTGLSPDETDWFSRLAWCAQCELDEIEKALSEANIHVWRRDGTPAGFSALFWRADHVEVNILAVDPAFRRQGLATEMLHAVRDMARERSLPQVRLYTSNDNTRALRLYQRIGFRLVALFPGEIEKNTGRVRIGYDGIPVRDLLELAWDIG